MRLGGRQSRSGRGGEQKNSHLPPGIESLNIYHIEKMYNIKVVGVNQVCTLCDVLFFKKLYDVKFMSHVQ